MTPVAAALADVSLGQTRSAGRLTVFPLIADTETEASYLLLDQALSSGLVSITETSSAGSVPELRVENRADRAVLIVDGEGLVGAKQNRIANLTVLVPAQTLTTIPVSCVERGRWSYRRRDFGSTDHVLYSQSRAQKAQHVSASMRVTGRPRSDQGAMWSGIASKAVRMSAKSDSEAMGVMFEQRRRDLDQLESLLGPQKNQTGAVFALDRRVVGLELFDASETWQRLSRKVLRSYGLDALDAGVRVTDEAIEIHHWLQMLVAAPVAQFPSVGLGQDVRFEHPQVAGGALVVGQTLIHCAAFNPSAWQTE